MTRLTQHLATIFGGPAKAGRPLRTIDDYCDAARRRDPELTSDRQLCLALGLSMSMISHLRCRRAWPEAETMVRLARLAGADPAQALLDLGMWRAKSKEVRTLYSRMAEKIRSTAAQVLIAGVTSALVAVASPASAEQTPHESTSDFPNYTLCDFALLWITRIRLKFQTTSRRFYQTFTQFVVVNPLTSPL